MSTTQIQVRIPHVSNLPQDVTVNTFMLDGPGATLDVPYIEDAMFAIGRFYGVSPTGGVEAVAAYMSAHVDLTAIEMRAYDLEAPEPRQPLVTVTESWSRPRLSAQDLPSEVAVALSYRGVFESGEPSARRRGRIFIGPLNAAVLSDTAAGVEVANQFLGDLVGAAERLILEIRDINGGLADVDWTVYSRGKGTLSLNNPDGTPDWTPFKTDVVQAWADNAFDTMRSRGLGSTARVSSNVV